jgi:hypothetical protein
MMMIIIIIIINYFLLADEFWLNWSTQGRSILILKIKKTGCSWLLLKSIIIKTIEWTVDVTRCNSQLQPCSLSEPGFISLVKKQDAKVLVNAAEQVAHVIVYECELFVTINECISINMKHVFSNFNFMWPCILNHEGE